MTDLQKKAIEQTKYWIDLANNTFKLNIKYPSISFKLKGVCAGKAISSRVTLPRIKYNAVLLEQNGDDFLKRTVPHEVAHIVVYEKDLNIFYPPKPHGREWKGVMRAFGLNSSRCHSYDTSNSVGKSKSKLAKSFEYKCGCRTYNLTIIRHRRVLKGATYKCRNCRKALIAA